MLKAILSGKALPSQLNLVRYQSSKVIHYVSSAHPKSHIYLVKYGVPSSETEAERRYRVMREENAIWNHFYWEENNSQFLKEKASFIEKEKLRCKEGTDDSAHEDLAVFYRDFLDRNYHKHISYNKEWYRRQSRLILPALLAYFASKKRRFKHWTSN